MTQLVEALQRLNLTGEIALSGRWVKIQDAGYSIYVIEGTQIAQYYTWGDAPGTQVVEFYRDPTEAIQAGLSRAERAIQDTEEYRLLDNR